jgi:AcrR family transcriptional regulator
VAHRGRPRSQEIDDAVRDALTDLLPRVGYSGLAIERVARQAGVGKPAIYRRWRSKAEMVFAVVFHDVDLPQRPDAGSLLGDLQSVLRDLMASFARPMARLVLPGLIGDLAGDPELVARFAETFNATERARITELLERAVLRGALEALPDPAEVHMMLIGPVFIWLFCYGRPPSMAAADRFAAGATAATVAMAAAC